MFRLLIVDDEAIIVDGLYEVLSAEKSLELDLFRAYSGEMALERLHKTRIDIVLTDINMPGMNGFELLEAIRTHWPECRVIFLTGHNHFEYAYKAIQYPGVSYLLKNEDYDKIINAVVRATHELRERVHSARLVQDAQAQMARAGELYQRTYLLRMLDGITPITPGVIESMGIPLDTRSPVLLALGQCTLPREDPPCSQRMTTYRTIELLIRQYLSSGMQVWIAPEDDGHFVLLMQPLPMDGVQRIQPVTFVQGMLEMVQNTCRESLEAPMSFVVSGALSPWRDIPERYKALADIMRRHAGHHMETLMVQGNAEPASSPEDNDSGLSALLRTGVLDRLPMLLDSGQKEQCDAVLQELTAHLTPIRSKNNNLAIEAYMRAAMGMLRHINSRQLSRRLSFRMAQYRLMRFDSFEDWGEAMRYLQEAAATLYEFQQDDQQDRATKTIQSVQQYMEHHLGDDLSLVVLAEYASLNPSYLSRLYKQATGENLTDTIETMRIARAKIYLAEGDWRIHEVGKRVGYETAGSFTRFFRKSTGLSPQEYRDLCRNVNKGEPPQELTTGDVKQ